MRPKLAEKAERMAIRAMKKIYISNYLNQGTKGHVNYDFADVAVNDDNLLFIDPVLLEMGQDAWCTKANEVVKSFFDMFYDAYKKKDRGKEKDILSHASEQNATHLGYGRGDNGKGTTAAGLLEIFLPIEELLQDIPAIGRAEDAKP